jgi:hypothetical protein
MSAASGWAALLGTVLVGPPALALLTYPASREVAIGSELPSGHEPFRLAYFTSPDAPETVAQHFLQRWVSAGIPVTFDRSVEGVSVVCAYFTREGWRRSVLVAPMRGGAVAFSVTEALGDAVGAELAPLPGALPPRTEGVLFVHRWPPSAPPGQEELISELHDQPLEGVRRERESSMAAAGFVATGWRDGGAAGKKQWTLHHQGPSGEVVTHLVEIGDRLTASVQMGIRSKAPPPPPDAGSKP